MKIAIKDNDIKRLDRVVKLLRTYYTQSGEEVEIDSFASNVELLNGFNASAHSIVFLEMERRSGDTPGVAATGMDIARELRKTTPYLPIIFMNWVTDSIVEFSFVAPRHYVFDAAQQESIIPVMNSISEQIETTPARTVCITCADRSLKVIPITEIVFAEIAARLITIHLYGGETVQTVGTMKKFTEQFSVYPEFITPHKSYLVNAVYISHISLTELSLKSMSVKIPVSRSKANSVIQAYQDYFQKYWILPYPKEDRAADIDT